MKNENIPRITAITFLAIDYALLILALKYYPQQAHLSSSDQPGAGLPGGSITQIALSN
jgi:hypothetical protein